MKAQIVAISTVTSESFRTTMEQVSATLTTAFAPGEIGSTEAASPGDTPRATFARLGEQAQITFERDIPAFAQTPIETFEELYGEDSPSRETFGQFFGGLQQQSQIRLYQPFLIQRLSQPLCLSPTR